MNIEIKNIHAIQSLVEHHYEKVISISGKPDNSRAKEILELAHKKNIKINIKDNKLIAYCKEPSVKDLKNSCLLYTSPSPRDNLPSRMPSSA